jgi:hypothetical protein
MRPLNQSHQRAASNKFSRMQASSSKFRGSKVLTSLTILHINSVEKNAVMGAMHHSRGGANFALERAARIYN